MEHGLWCYFGNSVSRYAIFPCAVSVQMFAAASCWTRVLIATTNTRKLEIGLLSSQFCSEVVHPYGVSNFGVAFKRAKCSSSKRMCARMWNLSALEKDMIVHIQEVLKKVSQFCYASSLSFSDFFCWCFHCSLEEFGALLEAFISNRSL